MRLRLAAGFGFEGKSSLALLALINDIGYRALEQVKFHRFLPSPKGYYFKAVRLSIVYFYGGRFITSLGCFETLYFR